MTSQGVGEPFGPGERIMAYQACAVRGGCYIDRDGEYGEKLTNLLPGCAANFRYVESKDDSTEIALNCRGTGTIRVLMNGGLAGTVTVENGVQKDTGIHMPAGQYELSLEIAASEGLEILELSLR